MHMAPPIAGYQLPLKSTAKSFHQSGEIQLADCPCTRGSHRDHYLDPSDANNIPAVVSKHSTIISSQMTQLSVDGESASTAAASSISADLNQIVNWCDVNGLSISTEKTLTMFLS